MGVHEGKNNVAIAIFGENPGCAEDKARALLDEVDDSVVDYGHKKDDALMRLYDITPAEVEVVGRERIPLLVRERSALLELEK
jgi:KEOPS complex subunit Cgi121